MSTSHFHPHSARTLTLSPSPYMTLTLYDPHLVRTLTLSGSSTYHPHLPPSPCRTLTLSPSPFRTLTLSPHAMFTPYWQPQQHTHTLTPSLLPHVQKLTRTYFYLYICRSNNYINTHHSVTYTTPVK